MFSEREGRPIKGRAPAEVEASPEAGQAAIGLVLIFCTLIFAGLALSVDVANLWFHRQATQSAADAACQAGAMDMLATSGGLKLNSMGFTPGTSGDCTGSSSATMCAYAKFNGYDGAGPQPASNTNSAWSTVSWSFPSSVPGATPPPVSMTATPYMQVSVVESVRTFFMGLFMPSHYQKVSSTTTCGLAQVKEAAPIVVLHPTMSGALNYSGGASLNIVGGPQRSLQVNSTSSTAILCSGSAVVNTSLGGPSSTGADLGVVGAEIQSQDGCGSNGGYTGFNGGTTGNWRSYVLPVPDPYSAVAAPTKPANAPSTKWVQYGVDGCPDTRNNVYVSGSQPNESCMEFFPGYYPSGLNVSSLMNSYSTAIFAPGIYYLNGSFSMTSSTTIRMAKPAGYKQTDGVMFYFLAGSFNVSGCSGCSNASIDNVKATDLTCDGSSPPAGLGIPSTGLGGNVLWAQCTQNGTYWDSSGDTTDSVGTPGNRGIVMFQGHADTSSSSMSGSGALAYAGSMYFHSNGYGTVLNLSGAAGPGSYILGNIVADQLNLSGSGKIGMQLSPIPSTYILKATAFQ